MNCPGCNTDVHPVQELQQNGRTMLSRCPRVECGTPMAMPPAVEVMLQDGAGLGVVRIEAQAAPATMPRSPIAYAIGASAEHSATPTDFIGQARERLASIEQQLVALEGLQREARKLRAMIAAADAADDEMN